MAPKDIKAGTMHSTNKVLGRDSDALVLMTTMKYVLAMLGLLVFVGRMLALPAAHIHCISDKHISGHTTEHDSSNHDPDHRDDPSHHNRGECLICQLAQTPVDTVAQVGLGLGQTLVSERAILSQMQVVATMVTRDNGSRDPPFST